MLTLRTRATALVCLASMLSPPILMMGCGTSGKQVHGGASAGQVGKEKVSEEVRTTLSFLSKEQMNDLVAGTHSIGGENLGFPGTDLEKAALAERLQQERGSPQNASVILGALAVFVVGEVLDLILEKVRERAEEYTAESKVAGSAVWIGKGKAEAAFEAVVVRRDRIRTVTKSDGTTAEKGYQNELCAIYRIAGAPGNASPERGLFSARPIYMRLARSQARTSTFNGSAGPAATVTMTLELEATGIDAANRPFKDKVLEFELLFPRRPLDQNARALVTKDELAKESTLFALPVRPAADVGVNAVLHIKEVDQGYDAKILNLIARFGADNKDKVIEVVNDQFGE